MKYDIIEEKYLDDGTNYQVVLPDTITEDTKIILYEHGSGGYGLDYDALNKKITEDGTDAIIVYYNRGKYNDLDQTEILNAVSNEYNVPITNFTGLSHSAGMEPSIITMSNIVKNNPDMDAPVLMSLDGSLLNNGNGHVGFALTEDVLQPLADSNAILFTVHRGAGVISEDPTYKKWIDEYGLNIVRITDLNANSSDHSIDHAKVKNDYAYNDLLSFQSGTGVFPSEGYIVQKYENGQWVEIDIAGMTVDEVSCALGVDKLSLTLKRLKSLNNIPYLGISEMGVVSDTLLLNNYLNNVLNVIRGSSLVKSDINFNISLSSTTNVPSTIPSLLKDYFAAKAELLDKISNDMYEFSKIGQSIDILDDNLSKDAENMDGVSSNNNITV